MSHSHPDEDFTASAVHVKSRLVPFYAISLFFIYCLLVIVWFSPTLWGFSLTNTRLLSLFLLVLLSLVLFLFGRGLLRGQNMSGKNLVRKLFYRRGLWISLGIPAVTFLYRCPFYLHIRGWINSDNSLTGLMAKHISEGSEPPLFLYGQLYLGSLTAHLAAPWMYFFGPSIYVLKCIPFISYALFCIFMYFTVRQLLGTRVAIGAISVLVFAPSHLFVLSFDTSGGFMEVLFISIFSFFLLLQVAEQGIYFRKHFGLPSISVAGFLLGAGFWANPMVLSSLFICFLMVIYLRYRLEVRGGVFFFVVSCIVGALPLILGELTYNFVQFRFLFFRESGGQFFSLLQFYHRFLSFFLEGVPALALSSLALDPVTLFLKKAIQMFFPIGLCCALFRGRKYITALLAKEYREQQPTFFTGLFYLHFFVFLSILILSGFGDLMNPPRYLTMGYFSLPLILAAPLSSRRFFFRLLSMIIIIAVISLSIFSTTLITKAAIESSEVWERYVHFLKSRKISYAECDYWVAYVTTFLTAEETICCVNSGKECFPEYCEIVQKHKPAYIFHTNLLHTKAHYLELRKKYKQGELSDYRLKRLRPLMIFYPVKKGGK